MGTNNSSPEALLSDYVVEKTSSNNGNSILRHKKTNVILLLRQISTTSQSDLNALIDRANRRKSLNHEHYLTLQEIFQKTEGSFCSTLYKANLLYQYGNHTLQHEIETRIDEGRIFQEKEIWSIICSSVLALSFLSRQNIEYEMISPSDIFLDNEGIVKIPDPDLASGTFNGGFSIKTTNYFSPQSLQGRHNPDKSCVFSLGICMLQTILMESMAACYNYQNGKLDQKQIAEKILQIKNKNMNSALVGVVQRMLTIDPKKRPSVLQLQQILFNLLRQQPSNCLQPATPSSSGAMEKKLGDADIEHQLISEKLQPIAPQKEEWVSLVVQTFQDIDTQNPDDAEDKAETTLTDRSNRVLGNSNSNNYVANYQNKFEATAILKNQPQNRVRYDNSSIKHEANKKEETLFTDPQLLQMLRKDIQDISLKKSKLLNHTNSTDISLLKMQATTVTQQSLKKHQTSTYSKPIESFDSEIQLKYVNENYARGRYEGQKRQNVRQGYGTFFYKEGGRYTGNWKNNKMHGKGTLYYANNKIAYEGDWIQDHLWGYGTLYNQDPQQLMGKYSYKSFDEVDEFWIKYQGQFVQDNKCGSGKLILSNDQMFEGQFDNDAIHGEGAFFCKDGKIVRGQWKQNILIKQHK